MLFERWLRRYTPRHDGIAEKATKNPAHIIQKRKAPYTMEIPAMIIKKHPE